MVYNVFFDVAAIVNLIVVLYSYLIHKHLPELKNKMFLQLCLATLGSTTVDLISAVALSKFVEVSIPTLWVLNTVYYVFVCYIPLSFCLYTLAITDEFNVLKTMKGKLIIMLPVFIQITFISLTPTFHLVYDINRAGEYVRQWGVDVLYGIMLFQIFTAVVIIGKCGSKIAASIKLYTYSFVVLSLVGIILQFLIPKVLIQHFAISVSLLLIFNSLQTADIIVDPVTGLLNLKSFDITASKIFRRGDHFAIVAVLLDDIQFLTSTFGVDGVNLLKGQITEFFTEIAPTYGIFQVEENVFCIMIPDASPMNYSRITANVTKRFHHSWRNKFFEIKLTARQCVIRCPEDADSVEVILDTITTIKTDPRYKNERLLFTDSIDISTRKRFNHVEQLVKTAIQERRVAVYYQPLYSTKDNRIVGAEALVRMKDKEGNFVSPDEFVPIAEQNGIILRIGLFVFEEVCRFLSTKKLKKYGINLIDINLSVAQCMQTRISEELLGILTSYGLGTDIINLEITETAAAHTPELLYSNMKKLTEMGFSCSLDDYGTGYANLNYMLHMPFSMIKIDKEIVWNAMKDRHGYLILVGIIDMMHKLDLKIVAEGIETQEMVDKLSALKCDYLQGYYYSKPVPEEEFFDMCRKQAMELGLFPGDSPEEDLSDVEELEVISDDDEGDLEELEVEEEGEPLF